MSEGPPPEPTPLELLADDAGLYGDELREWLRAEIERRRADAQRIAGSVAQIRIDRAAALACELKERLGPTDPLVAAGVSGDTTTTTAISPAVDGLVLS